MDIEKLNKILADSCYVAGHQPTQADVEEFNKFHSFVHFQRWVSHIASFSEAERRKWPKVQAQAQGKGKAAPAPRSAPAAGDDDLDLFGSDDDGEAEKLKQRRQQEAGSKKKDKKEAIAKSSVVLDVKTWDDETDLKDVEEQVRAIQMDGLLWGASKTVPLAFGISKLQIGCVVEDEKVSIDELTEKIEELDLVQSTDVAAFQKI